MSKSDLTRQRILDAATIEFANYGIAGARVDRIAANAPANKSQIYAYFGDKETLFDIVLTAALERGAQAISVDQSDLPEYAGALFDHLVEHPELLKLGLWRQLERPESAAPGEEDAWRVKVDYLAGEQAAGNVDPRIPAPELLSLVLAVTQAWYLAPQVLTTGHLSVSRATQRAAVVTTVAAVTQSKTATTGL